MMMDADAILEQIKHLATLEDDTDRIAGMSDEELSRYRVIGTKGRVHLIPKDQAGIPIEETFTAAEIPDELRGARVFINRHGEQVIAQVADDE